MADDLSCGISSANRRHAAAAALPDGIALIAPPGTARDSNGIRDGQDLLTAMTRMIVIGIRLRAVAEPARSQATTDRDIPGWLSAS
jgi:hypothetical protein